MFFHLARQDGGAFTRRIDPGPQDHIVCEIGPNEHIELLGDPVFRERSRFPENVLDDQGRVELTKLFDEVAGHYYWFHWRGDALECGTSFCGLLPLFHRHVGGQLDLSSSAFHIARVYALEADDRRYLLERSLFNYPLFDRTPWKGIRRLPSSSRLVAGDPLKIERCFRVQDQFGEGARSSASDMISLCDVFEHECDLYIPRSGFALSFTGGFDGRTLLGAALRLGRSGFTTYGFGRPGESDIALPERQARELDVPYQPILLDERYLSEHALPSAIAFMEWSDHAGNLGRPHYHHAARILAEQYTHLVTGNFGSELFRALHAPGALMTGELIALFSDPAWRERLTAVAGPDLKLELQELIADVEVYLATDAGLSPSQRFHRFVFDELFRKYFGPEIMVQGRFLRNRTPFLSFRFMKALHRTKWAGVHTRLFEANKFRRMKGQIFYAAYLKHVRSPLYRMPTNKGYTPAEILEPWRLPMLATKVLWQRWTGGEKVDSNSILAFHRQYHEALLRHYGLEARTGEDLQGLSNRAAWAAALRVADRDH